MSDEYCTVIIPLTLILSKQEFFLTIMRVLTAFQTSPNICLLTNVTQILGNNECNHQRRKANHLLKLFMVKLYFKIDAKVLQEEVFIR